MVPASSARRVPPIHPITGHYWVLVDDAALSVVIFNGTVAVVGRQIEESPLVLDPSVIPARAPTRPAVAHFARVNPQNKGKEVVEGLPEVATCREQMAPSSAKFKHCHRHRFLEAVTEI